MQSDDKVTLFDASRCRPGLRLRANQMIQALLGEDAADRWASHCDVEGDCITPDDLAGLVPPPREIGRIDDAMLACMLQDFAVMGVFAVQSGQFDDHSLLEPLMDLQASACAVARSCADGSHASVELLANSAVVTQRTGAARVRGVRP